MKKPLILLAIATLISMAATAQTFSTAEYLDINRVNARYMVHGDMFWNPTTGNAAYEFPKGSGKHSGFASSFWIGGFNASTSALHLAAQTYRSGGNDYWPGPLDPLLGGSSDTMKAANWAKIWKVNKTTIDSFLTMTTHTIANTVPSILEWPGRQNPNAKTPANTALTIPNRPMAPFVDVNNDNIYNALDGDYPDIKGEQMLWWVFNDNTTAHTQSGGQPLKIEIHASAYACNQIGLENTTFLNYQILNFSTSIYDSTVLSFWNDIDLGYAFDDYIGFDSTYRMGVTYNGDPFDETPQGYGTNLTQKAAVIIKQPGDLSTSLAPVGAFTFYSNVSGNQGDPSATPEYYNYMTGSWRTGQLFSKGCNPLDSTQPSSKYCFPDDPSMIGGISEVACSNAPNDRRFLMSSKPFQLQPGATPIEFTFAFINTDTGVNNSNFNELRRLADSAYMYADACGGNAAPLAVNNFRANNLSVYPNPTSGYFVIEDADADSKNISLYNAVGEVVYRSISNDQKTTIQTNDFAEGIYYLKIDKKNVTFSQSILIK